MADIDLYHDGNDDAADDGYGLDDGSGTDSDTCGADDDLTTLQKLEKYIESDNVFTRQMVARGLLDTLRSSVDSEEDCHAVLKAMVRLSEDPEPTVRIELMELIPHLAEYCNENGCIFQSSVPDYMLPIIVRYLNNANPQVRKTGQAALLVLLERELVDKVDIEEQVIDVILELSSADNLDDYRTEAVALMSKMAPLLGRDVTERFFLERFSCMCTDPLFHVRKVCAANFGEFCQVNGPENTEKVLLPKFYYLCEDGVWGVRKACAECFMTVSCACSQRVRREELAGLFVSLLCDQSRWVTMAAFQQLGPFISTFADPKTTGLVVNDDGTLSVGTTDKHLSEEEILSGNFIARPHKKDESENDSDNEDPDEKSDSEKCSSLESSLENREKELETDRISASSVPEETAHDDSSMELEKTDDLETGNSRIVGYDISDISYEEIRASSYNENTLENASSEILGSEGNVKYTQHAQTDIENDDPLTNLSGSVLQGSEVSSSVLSVNNSNSSSVHIHSDNLETFSSFQFWKQPIPVIDLNLEPVNRATNNLVSVENSHNQKEKNSGWDLQESSETALTDSLAKVFINDMEESEEDCDIEDSLEMKFHTADVNTVSETGETVDNFGSTHVMGHEVSENELTIFNHIVQSDTNSSISFMDSDSSSSKENVDISFEANLDNPAEKQVSNIVPQSLLENYLGMVDPSRAHTVDNEITRHCAYNLPAVAYTLGRKNWHCIRNLYYILAQDMQWKVRRTLAFSIHELAVILGDEITNKDLVPIFHGFLRDLDEVRIGVLKHFYDFLKLLKPDVRATYLDKLQDFLITDNQRNWRFRLELAEQLKQLCELYSAREISQHIIPLALVLAADKVAEVRQSSIKLVAVILKRLREEESLVLGLVKDLVDKFALNPKWNGRQIYAQLCSAILEEEAISPDKFTQVLLPELLVLRSDAVPNIRLSVGRTLAKYIINNDNYTSSDNPHCGELKVAIAGLLSDKDRDVRYVTLHPVQTEIDPDLNGDPDDDDVDHIPI